METRFSNRLNMKSYAVDSKLVGDITVYFNQATYKFVPEGYEFTDEENQNIDDPHYVLHRALSKYSGKAVALPFFTLYMFNNF